MSGSRLGRWLRRPGLQSAVLLVATLVLAAGLAYQAARAAASHRAMAEGTLDHYAAIAAWQYARNARIWVGFGMNQAGAALGQEIPRPGKGPLPGPELVRRVLAEKDCDCMSAGFAHTVFRITPGAEPTFAALGETLSDATRSALVAAVAADSARREGPRQWRIFPPGEPHLGRPDDLVLLWDFNPSPTVGTSVRTVYGMVVEKAQIERPLQGAMTDVEFFPPSLVGRSAPDSLVRIQVTAPNGRTLFGRPPQGMAFMGTDTMGWLYGTLGVAASIAPIAAERLVTGGVPGSRAPQIVALLALTLAFGSAALLLLRREQHLARLRDDFVSGVSHELRTPLTQIRMLSELLETDGFKAGSERARATRVIHREALKLTNLVDNVLQFARFRRAAEPATDTVTSLPEVATELAESFQPLLEASANRLELDVKDDLSVAGDRDSVARILRNLLENALKFGPPGQTIRLTLDRILAGPGRARISISDEGAGIPPADRARIWQPYQRLERDRNVAIGGSGLGLAVVAELVGRLGGKTWVEDAEPHGARFIVELPLATGRTP